MSEKDSSESLEKTINEIQTSNEVLALSVQRTRLSVRRLRFQYATLLERLQQRIEKDPSLDCEDPLPSLKELKDKLDSGSNSTGFLKSVKSSITFTETTTNPNKANLVIDSRALKNGLTLYSKRKLAKLRRDPNMPKRPTNAYLFFCEINKDKLREQSGPLADMSKVLTEAWRNLLDDEKTPYFELYNQDKIRYQREMKEYSKEKENESENVVEYDEDDEDGEEVDDEEQDRQEDDEEEEEEENEENEEEEQEKEEEEEEAEEAEEDDEGEDGHPESKKETDQKDEDMEKEDASAESEVVSTSSPVQIINSNPNGKAKDNDEK